MDKIWLKSYPEGMPTEIDSTLYRSVTHLLEEAFRKYADRNAYVCIDKFMTYRELDRMSAQMAAWLQAKGLKPGTRVAIMLPNVLQYPVAMAAILRAGCTVVNVNPLYTPRELQHQLIDSGAEAIIVLENFATTVEQVLPHTPALKHIVVAAMGDLLGGLKGAVVNLVVRKVKKLVPAFSLPGATPFKRMLAEGARHTLQPVAQGHDDIAFLQYTGGTTGVSKGAVLLHRNVIANMLQTDAWLSPAFGADAEQIVFVCALPLYHIYSLTVSALMGTRLGGLNLLIPNPRDIPGFVKELAKYKVAIFPAVNTLYNALMNNPDFAKLDFSSYKVCNSGGMAVQQVVAAKWLKMTGCPIIEGYGLSETSPIVTANRVDIKEFTGTIGLPLPSTEVAIVDDEGVPVALGQTGEIAVRGPQVMAGYWQRDDETAKVMTADGFFKTGDIGVMDERGYTRIVDRKKDMIIVSGFNVYPNEIEDVVASCPGVLECACIGVPDQHTGEAVKVFIVRRDPALTSEQVLAFCKHELTAYKKPKFIEFRDELPKTNVGKILRRQLRDEKKAA